MITTASRHPAAFRAVSVPDRKRPGTKYWCTSSRTPYAKAMPTAVHSAVAPRHCAVTSACQQSHVRRA